MTVMLNPKLQLYARYFFKDTEPGYCGTHTGKNSFSLLLLPLEHISTLGNFQSKVELVSVPITSPFLLVHCSSYFLETQFSPLHVFSLI